MTASRKGHVKFAASDGDPWTEVGHLLTEKARAVFIAAVPDVMSHVRRVSKVRAPLFINASGISNLDAYRIVALMRVEPGTFVKRVKQVSESLAFREDLRIMDVTLQGKECTAA